MSETPPIARRDLEFFPVQHQGQQLVLIRDHLGLVQEGKAVGLHLYHMMTLLDGTTTLRDLQVEFMSQKGGVLVGMDEINGLWPISTNLTSSIQRGLRTPRSE